MAGGGAPGALSLHWQLIAAVVVLLLLALVFLLRRAGAIRLQSTAAVSGVAILLIAYFLTSYVVARHRQSGQMTLLESQTMDMSSMRPPEGAVPVATEPVKVGLFAPAATYTGTVVAYTDEDVYPRVAGTIVSMPVYPGDRVSAGSLLVRLDDRELSARERQALWDREMAARARRTSERELEMAGAARRQAEAETGKAGQDLRVMERERASAQAMVKEAQSEVRGAERDLEAGRQELVAAQAAQEAAASEASMAASRVESAQADLESMRADAAYWQAEIAREKKLLDSGAVSLDEYQNEEARNKDARAKVARAEAMVRESKQGQAAAEARRRQAAADAAKAQARLASMEAGLDKARAAADRAVADAESAGARVDSARAGVRAARAMGEEKSAAIGAAASRTGEAAAAVGQRTEALTAARTIRGYTEIRARRSGYVTQRLVSPGVLVQPGTPILRVSDLDRVRLQAYVSERDVKLLEVGGRVEATSPKLPGGSIVARITSIFPAADPTTRTSIVEAVVDNSGRRLFPGDAISMKLHGRGRGGALSVPTSAIVNRNLPARGPSSAQQATVWTAAAGGQPGAKKAHQVDVTVGLSSGDRTEILTGLRSGDEVIYRGNEYLKEGDQVYPVAWGEAGPIVLPPAPQGEGTAPGGEGTGPASGPMSAPVPRQ
jgi:RND family efflux transporter MFP subunit